MGLMERATARILDANLNRAREAARVAEDHARFALNEADLAGGYKRLRHGLAEVAARLPAGELAAVRDTPGDVGTRIATPQEQQRDGPSAVAIAAAKRLSEALRVLEEYAKTVSGALGAAFERLRYDGYELERRLVLRCSRRARFADVRLYVLITEALCRGGDWLVAAAAAIEGGADCVQLREKDRTDGELLARARRLADLAHRHGRLCIVNDRPDIAWLAGADGVHLGTGDLPASAARKIVGPDLLIGLSSHTVEQARAAGAEGPDYLACGPMFASSTKPQAHIAGAETLGAVRAITKLPLVAIGGIDAGNVGAVVAAGADAVAVCSAVIGAADPKAAAAALRALADHRPTTPPPDRR